MKKFSFNKQYFTISCYALAVIILSVISVRIIVNIEGIWQGLVSMVMFLAGALSAFVYGFFIAFFLNAPVRFIERKLYGRVARFENAPRAKRFLAVASVYVISLGIFFWVMTFVFPEIADSFSGLIELTQTAVMSLYGFGLTDLANHETLNEVVYAINQMFGTGISVQDLLDQVVVFAMTLLNEVPGVMGQAYTNIIEAMRNIFNFIIGIIISFYMLYQKENIAAGLVRILRAFFRHPYVDSAIGIARQSEHILERFIVGRILDSAIIGTMFFLVALIMGIPFPLLLTLIFATSNIIPYFGAIVGGVIVSIIVMFQNPMMGLWTGVACLILQQFGGNILGPKIMGDSVGLNPLSVIFSILLGASLFGVPGMFFGPPVFAVFKTLFMAFVDKKYSAKYHGEEA